MKKTQLLKNFIYKVFELQETFLKLRLSKTIGVKNKSKRKQHYIKGCTLDLSSMAEVEKQELEEKIVNILKKYDYNPVKIAEYIKSQGTEVIFNNNASQLLNSIGENEGFIMPQKGFSALYLSLAFKQKFAFKTDEMFILPSDNINKYYFIYHFYNWFAFKNNICGLDNDSQKLLKKYLFTQADTKELQLEDIYKLKDAIRQDKASIEFVIKLCRNYDGAKQALNKMQDEGSAKL